MLFKVAITIVGGQKPYLVQVAVPNGQGKFLIYDYRFSRAIDATMMAMDYFNTYEKTPESILRFHLDTVEKREANLELPFFSP